MVKYWYGLRDGKVVSIQDIPKELKGLACGCICPACHRPLEACSLGPNNKRVRHFKHAKEFDPNVTREGSPGGCDVFTANESGLHLLAKQIIQEECKVMIPAFKIYAEDILNDIPVDIYRKLPPFVVEDASVLICAAVELEKYINGFKPDIVMQLPSRVTHELLVEINAGHSVDEEKLRNVKAHGFPMMEIDVRSFRDKAYKKEELRQFLLESCAEREWIYFPLRKDVREKAREFFENIEDVIKYRKDKANREKGKAKITALLDSKTYTSEINRLRSDVAFQQWCSQHSSKFRFIKEAGKVPFYIDIPISGELIFKCDRRIWQGIIFGRYVYDRTVKEEGSHIPSDDLFTVLRDDYSPRGLM